MMPIIITTTNHPAMSPTAPNHDDLISEGSSTSTAGSSPASATSQVSNDKAAMYHSPEFHPAHSHADKVQEAHEPQPHLHRRMTDNYERDLKAQAVAAGNHDPDAAHLAYRSDPTIPDAPPALNTTGRQPSFKLSDQKRAAMERTFNSDPKSPGYTTTSPSAGK
ncbi:hypothetical protein D6D01_03631 [Aureobasidium pullulans]|uniref:Uncharacterized protein n=1 Tax=Aureobasidium pullulans TaxID=5580 RepID=A0A4S9LIB4_AURPU|nr:hypothetical protein D6D01_03631 [Aureobasidium pullulans]